jgi:hypothetical protein
MAAVVPTAAPPPAAAPPAATLPPTAALLAADRALEASALELRPPDRGMLPLRPEAVTLVGVPRVPSVVAEAVTLVGVPRVPSVVA